VGKCFRAIPSLAFNCNSLRCSVRFKGDEMPRAKGPTTRAMARRIQEEWALNAHVRPKMKFTWANEYVKT